MKVAGHDGPLTDNDRDMPTLAKTNPLRKDLKDIRKFVSHDYRWTGQTVNEIVEKTAAAGSLSGLCVDRVWNSSGVDPEIEAIQLDRVWIECWIAAGSTTLTSTNTKAGPAEKV